MAKRDWITPGKTYSLTEGKAIFVKKGVYTTKQYMDNDYCVMLFFMNDDFIKDFIAENLLGTDNEPAVSTESRVTLIHTDHYFETLVNSIFNYFEIG